MDFIYFDKYYFKEYHLFALEIFYNFNIRYSLCFNHLIYLNRHCSLTMIFKNRQTPDFVNGFHSFIRNGSLLILIMKI